MVSAVVAALVSVPRGSIAVELAEGRDDRTGRDLDVGQDGVGAHAGALADAGGAAQEDTGLEGHVPSELDGHVHPGAGRIDHADSRPHPALQRAAVQLRAELGELSTIVAALHEPVVGDDQGRHGQVMARCSGLASRCSTMADTVPSASRTTRP